MMILVATRCKTWICVRSLAVIAGSNHTGDIDVCLLGGECCALSGGGLCDGLITRPEESCRVCGVSDYV